MAGLTLGAEYIGDYLAAGLIEAAKADVASLTAFEIGLFDWMALMTFVFFPPRTCAPTAPCTGSSGGSG